MLFNLVKNINCTLKIDTEVEHRIHVKSLRNRKKTWEWSRGMSYKLLEVPYNISWGVFGRKCNLCLLIQKLVLEQGNYTHKAQLYFNTWVHFLEHFGNIQGLTEMREELFNYSWFRSDDLCLSLHLESLFFYIFTYYSKVWRSETF